jgi:hypothetical protein
MTGFQNVDPASSSLGDGVAQESVDNLMRLLDGENEPQQPVVQAPSGEETHEAPLQPAIEQLDSSHRTEEQPEGNSGQDEPRYKVKTNGQEQEVTLNDLIEGFQLKSDYTRSKQELADRERELGREAQQIVAQKQQYSDMVDLLQQRLKSLIPPEPDWAKMAQADPINYTRQKAAWDQLQQQVQTVEQEQNRIAEERKASFQQQYQGYLQDQQARLLAARPELKEPEKRTVFFTDITNYAVNEYGYTPQEVMSVADHRLMLIVEKAMKFDALQRSRQKVETPAARVPVLRPGPAQTTEPVAKANLKAAKKRLARSGSTRDASSAIESLLG